MAMIVKTHSIARRLDCRDSWHSSSSWAGKVWIAIDIQLLLLLKGAFTERAMIELQYELLRLLQINLNGIYCDACGVSRISWSVVDVVGCVLNKNKASLFAFPGKKKAITLHCVSKAEPH